MAERPTASARRAAIFRQLGELFRELAEDEGAVDGAPPQPPAEKQRRRPVAPLVAAPLAPPDELMRARARRQLERKGFRRP